MVWPRARWTENYNLNSVAHTVQATREERKLPFRKLSVATFFISFLSHRGFSLCVPIERSTEWYVCCWYSDTSKHHTPPYRTQCSQYTFIGPFSIRELCVRVCTWVTSGYPILKITHTLTAHIYSRNQMEFSFLLLLLFSSYTHPERFIHFAWWNELCY